MFISNQVTGNIFNIKVLKLNRKIVLQLKELNKLQEHFRNVRTVYLLPVRHSRLLLF